MWVSGDPFLAGKLQNISCIWGLRDHITSNILKAIFHKFYLVNSWVLFFRYTFWRHYLDIKDAIGCCLYSRFSHSCPCSWYQSIILVLSNFCKFFLLKVCYVFFLKTKQMKYIQTTKFYKANIYAVFSIQK